MSDLPKREEQIQKFWEENRIFEKSLEKPAPKDAPSTLGVVGRYVLTPAIFDLLADPSRHHEIDGSGSVRDAKEGSRRLALGDRFGMSMKLGLPYSMVSEVIEFEPDRRIAWQTFPPGPGRYLLGGRICFCGRHRLSRRCASAELLSVGGVCQSRQLLEQQHGRGSEYSGNSTQCSGFHRRFLRECGIVSVRERRHSDRFYRETATGETGSFCGWRRSRRLDIARIGTNRAAKSEKTKKSA